MRYEFIEVPTFMRRRDEFFADDEVFARFQAELAGDPARGSLIKGTGGLRKIRWGDERTGRGKRGGCRIIYLEMPVPPRARTGLIFLLYVYPKSQKDDLTTAEAKALERLANTLKQEAKTHYKF